MPVGSKASWSIISTTSPVGPAACSCPQLLPGQRWTKSGAVKAEPLQTAFLQKRELEPLAMACSEPRDSAEAALSQWSFPRPRWASVSPPALLLVGTSISSTVPLVCNVYYYTLKFLSFRKVLRNICSSFQPEKITEISGNIFRMSETTGFPASFLFQRNSPITTRGRSRVTCHLENSGLTGLWERWFCVFSSYSILAKSCWVLDLCMDCPLKNSMHLFRSGRCIIQKAKLVSEALILPGHTIFSHISVCNEPWSLRPKLSSTS